MDKQIAAKGRLKTYLMIPLALTAVWAALIVVLYFVDRNACLLTGFFMAIYLCLTLFLYYYRQNRLLDELIAFATQYGQVQKELLNDFILPYALLDEDGVLLWANKEFNDIIEDQKKKHRPIWNYLPELLKEDLPGRIQETEKEMRIGNRDYRAAMKKVFMQDFLENNSVVETDPDTFLIALYLFDETEINEATREKEANRHVCGVLSLDNMEECLDSVEDVRQSLLLALVEKKITNFFTNVGGMVRKVDKDRFIFVINKVAFEEMKATRFTIVDFVKTVNIGNSMSFTISMGLSINNGTYNDDMEAARVAHELALGRGGDQVVVRDGESTTYYGGKSLSV
ncbi:MAG: DHH family phosphoesterase, partial [Lachnospiraceae bacterium]|nr:DHH family phosphoesterase [Lachnospiraceae bacterium]